MESKPICLHFHIFKNAGTTIEWILKKNFSKNAVNMDTDDPNGILSFERVQEVLDRNPDMKSFSSHQIRFPVPRINGFEFLPILFLRNPIDRAFSIYSFQRKRTDANRPGIIKARELNLNDYLKWSFKLNKFRVMKNFQVIFLSDKGLNSIVDESDLIVATKRVLDCSIIGVVDRFDESLVLVEEVLRKYFSKIDLAYVKLNVSKERKGDLTSRIKVGKDMLEKSVWGQLLKDNELDMKLYQKMNEMLDKRLEKITELKTKLNDFRKRCEELQNPIRRLMV